MIVEFVTSLNFEATSVRVFNGLFTLIFLIKRLCMLNSFAPLEAKDTLKEKINANY